MSEAKRYLAGKPAFGQTGAAQGYLQGQKVDVGDIFLFSEHFIRQKKRMGNCHIAGGDVGRVWDFYVKSDLHIIYAICRWRDHYRSRQNKKRISMASSQSLSDKNNVLYIPADKLIIMVKIRE